MLKNNNNNNNNNNRILITFDHKLILQTISPITPNYKMNRIFVL